MALSPELRDHVLDLLQDLGAVSARPMFGGAGLYLDGTMFGLLTRNDVFYLRTDEVNRGQFEAAGCEPFVPFADGRMTMPYHQAPPALMEDAEAMCAWARHAWEAGRRAKVAGAPKRRRKKPAAAGARRGTRR